MEGIAWISQRSLHCRGYYRNGTNPVTGESLGSGERPIYVQGEPGSSGVIMQGIVRAVTNPTSPNAVTPTIFQPSVSHWLALANFQSGRELFDLADSPATANAPVVISIWESRLEAIRNTVGRENIGWADLLAVLNSPNGWADYGIEGRQTVYYGHTDPFVSSTALSTLISEFYASANANGFTGRRLTMAEVEAARTARISRRCIAASPAAQKVTSTQILLDNWIISLW